MDFHEQRQQQTEFVSTEGALKCSALRCERESNGEQGGAAGIYICGCRLLRNHRTAGQQPHDLARADAVVCFACEGVLPCDRFKSSQARGRSFDVLV